MNVVVVAGQESTAGQLKHMLLDAGHLVLSTATNGESAFEMICALSPDVVLAQVVLAGLDGPGLVQKICREGNVLAPGFVLHSPFALPEGIDVCGAHCCKTLEMAVDLVERAVQRPLDDLVSVQIDALLWELGFAPHVRGSAYVHRALALCLQNGDRLRNLQDLLYTRLAYEFRQASSNIERDIRYAIEHAWRYGRLQSLEAYFGYTVLPERGKPTNKAFLAQAMQPLRRQLCIKKRLYTPPNVKNQGT